MRPTRTWHRASLLIALGLIAASVTVFAANRKPDQQGNSFAGIIQGRVGPAFSLMNPGHESWLGLIVKDTDEAKTKELKLPHVTGVLVVSVIPGSPAAKAGFQKNDVILEFDGQRVRSVAQLHRLVKETPPDRTVKVRITRQGKLETLQAKIESRGPSAFLEMPANPKIWQWPYNKPPAKPHPFLQPVPKGRIIPLPPVMPKFYLGPLPNLKPQLPPELKPFIEPGPKGEARPFLNPRPARENALGISGQDLTPQLARFFGVKEGKGVLISQVDKGSPASSAGLKAGDVIVRVGRQEVGSMTELRWALQNQANGQHKVTLGVVRNREERQMSVLLAPGRLTPHGNGVRPEPIMARRGQ
jgi:serine protease Do